MRPSRRCTSTLRVIDVAVPRSSIRTGAGRRVASTARVTDPVPSPVVCTVSLRAGGVPGAGFVVSGSTTAGSGRLGAARRLAAPPVCSGPLTATAREAASRSPASAAVRAAALRALIGTGPVGAGPRGVGAAMSIRYARLRWSALTRGTGHQGGKRVQPPAGALRFRPG